MNIRPGECYVVDHNGARCTASLYPTREERLLNDVPVLVARIAELAADNARLQRRVAQLEADVDALEAALKCALAGRAR